MEKTEDYTNIDFDEYYKGLGESTRDCDSDTPLEEITEFIKKLENKRINNGKG